MPDIQDITFNSQQGSSFFENLKFNNLLKYFVLAILILSIPITMVVLRQRQQTRQNAGSSTEFGMAIDIRDQNKVPTTQNVSSLNPSWVRFVYPCVNSSINNNSCPNDWHSVNLLSSVPSGVKKLAVITGDTTWNAPIGSTDFNTWKNYSDNVFVPTVSKIADGDGANLQAIELWNEEDLNAGASYDPYIPPDAFAYMIASASSAIKRVNQNIKVITGGLAAGNFSNYLLQMKQAVPSVFDNVDAVAIHPYQSPENVNAISTQYSTLRTALDQNSINKPIWVTEIGIQEFTHTESPKNQSDFLQSAFGQLQALNAPVVIWYAYIDYMNGGDGSSGWGLVDGNRNLKESGKSFISLTTLPTPTPNQSTNTKLYIDLDAKGGATVIATGSKECSSYILDNPLPSGAGLLNCQKAGGYSCDTTNPENDGNACWWKWTCTQGQKGTYTFKFGVDPSKNSAGDACASNKTYTINSDSANICPNPLIFGGVNGPFVTDPIPQLIKDITIKPSYRNIVISWKNIQPNQNSSYDFSSYDTQLQNILSQNQTPVIIFCEGDCFPDWIRKSNSSVANCCSSDYVCRVIQDSDSATQSFIDMVTTAAQHFKGKVNLWDYGLEPNCRGYDATTFTNLLKKFSTAVRGVDSQNKIIAGHFSGAAVDYINQVYSNGAKDYFDKIAIDPYGQNGAFLETAGIEQLHDLMTSKGDGNKPIWISEWGIQTNGNEANQANLISAGLKYMATKPWIEAAFYLDHECDIGNEGCHPGDPHYLGYALYKYGTGPNDITPKEAYTAFKNAENACTNIPTPTPFPGMCTPGKESDCPAGYICQATACPSRPPCPPGALCPLYICDKLYTCVKASPTPTPIPRSICTPGHEADCPAGFSCQLVPSVCPTQPICPTGALCPIHACDRFYTCVADSVSPTPTPSPTPTSAPTPTLIPTPTFVPGGKQLNFSLTLVGLGTAGTNPFHSQKNLKVELYDSKNTAVRTTNGLITFDGTNHIFTGTIDLSTGLASGNYTLKIKPDGYLRKLIPASVNITATSSSILIAPAALVGGDINNDNVIDIRDYNYLTNCYGDKQHSSSCPDPNAADLNDDGKVDGVDYNIFIRGLSSISGS